MLDFSPTCNWRVLFSWWTASIGKWQLESTLSEYFKIAYPGYILDFDLFDGSFTVGSKPLVSMATFHVEVEDLDERYW